MNNEPEISLAAGRIMAATVTAPAFRADIKYSASVRRAAGDVWACGNEYPVNLLLEKTDTLLKIIPAKVGDPCLLYKDGGRTKLICLTEKIGTGAC